MPQGHPRPRHAAWAVLTALLLAASCGGDDAPESRPRPTTTAPTTAGTTTPTTLSVEAEVEAAYDAYRDMVKRLTAAPNPDDPELEQRTTGEALTDLTDDLSTLQAVGHSIRVGPNFSTEVIDIRVSTEGAVVTECMVDESQQIDAEGRVVAEDPIVTTQFDLRMTLVDGTWRTSEVEQTGGWEGIAGCAV